MDTTVDHFTPLALCVRGKYVPLVKQNVMELEVFILGGQRIEKEGMVEREKREDREREQREHRDREKRDKRELS